MAKLKMTFICGSLEPGKDGVGDYTRTLAKELIEKGQEVQIIALNDRHITNQFIGIQTIGSVEIPVNRLPSNVEVSTKTQLAKDWIDRFNPHWISLQFVIFSFHPKGLPFGLVEQLSAIGSGRKWHIMFHELWVAMGQGASTKQLLWAWLQRRIIQKLIKTLQPEVIHTQISLYKKQLSRLNINAAILPLFSNISKAKNQIDAKERATNKASSDCYFVLFGWIHPGAMLDLFAYEIVAYQALYKVKVMLQLVGRSGPEQERWLAIWRSKGLSIEVLGEMPSEEVSKVLNSATLGITTSAYQMVQKSGSVSAMIDHGLPILCVSQEYKIRNVMHAETLQGIYQLKKGILENCIRSPEIPATHSPSSIANKFLNSFPFPHKKEYAG